MSKPEESTGESLDSILAAIRRSLSEQATDALEEDPAPPAAPAASQAASAPPLPDATPATPSPVAAAAAADAPQAKAGAPGDRAPAAPAGAQPAPPPAAAAAAEPVPALVPVSEKKDPLWFLGGPGAPAQKQAGTDAKPARDIVRGPLPPFFGSSAEAAEGFDGPGFTGSGPAALEAASPPAGRMHPGAAAGDAGLNGSAGSLLGHAADGRTGTMGGAPQLAGEPSQVHTLEAMVAELLRPMLRRWLDENMPRLVSAALKQELALMAERESKKH